ncbi:hypothetical protein QBC45DRAFT_423668 [Copromyces sp. CBS 386.78]|nr:hypothetical protein QBC45DRAFT_423668 [Copromyces sp. CBS 386.78]
MAYYGPWHWDWKPFSGFQTGKNRLLWMLPSASISGISLARLVVPGCWVWGSMIQCDRSMATLTGPSTTCPRIFGGSEVPMRGPI